MGQFMLFFILLMIAVVIAGCWAALTRSRMKIKDELIQSKEAVVETENQDLFYVEYVPAEISKSVNKLTVAPDVQDELLHAGFVVLRKIDNDIRECLVAPIFSSNLVSWLSPGNQRDEVSSDLARATAAVLEVVLVFQTIMSQDSRPNQLPLAVDKQTGIIIAGEKIFSPRCMIKPISRRVGIPEGVANALWCSILEILHEDMVKIPGVKVVKLFGTNFLQRSGQ